MSCRAVTVAVLLFACLTACKTVAGEAAAARCAAGECEGCHEVADNDPAEDMADAMVEAVYEIAPDLQAGEVGSIKNLHVFGDIWLAGQPSADDFALARLAGVETVVNLRRADEPTGFDVEACVAEQGMAYANPAFRGPDELTDDVFGEVRRLLDDAERPLLMHCGSANRVGAVWIPWRVLDQGVPLEQAVAEAREIGLRTPEYEALALDYVARNQQP